MNYGKANCAKKLHFRGYGKSVVDTEQRVCHGKAISRTRGKVWTPDKRNTEISISQSGHFPARRCCICSSKSLEPAHQLYYSLCPKAQCHLGVALHPTLASKGIQVTGNPEPGNRHRARHAPSQRLGSRPLGVRHARPAEPGLHVPQRCAAQHRLRTRGCRRPPSLLSPPPHPQCTQHTSPAAFLFIQNQTSRMGSGRVHVWE